jgi:hypothetical protein
MFPNHRDLTSNYKQKILNKQYFMAFTINNRKYDSGNIASNYNK